MHIVVTGGAGYIGSTLVPLLLDGGHRVTVVDRLYFGDSALRRAQDTYADQLRLVRAAVRRGVASQRAPGAGRRRYSDRLRVFL